MKKETLGNCFYRAGLLEAIKHIMDEKEVSRITFEASTYSSEKDMVHFTCDGHKCILLEIEKPDTEKGTCIMTVMAKGKELKDWEDVRLNFDMWHFKIKTLERISNESYDYIKDSDDEEWEKVVQGYFEYFESMYNL